MPKRKKLNISSSILADMIRARKKAYDEAVVSLNNAKCRATLALQEYVRVRGLAKEMNLRDIKKLVDEGVL